MKDSTSLHDSVQAHIDCYGDNDPLSEMSRVIGDTDTAQAAVKWVALAALHGITGGARKIVLDTSGDGSTQVTAVYREAELPDPGPEVGKQIIETLREITHIRSKKGELPLALGLRGSSIGLDVKFKRSSKGEKVILSFPAVT